MSLKRYISRERLVLALSPFVLLTVTVLQLLCYSVSYAVLLCESLASMQSVSIPKQLNILMIYSVKFSEKFVKNVYLSLLKSGKSISLYCGLFTNLLA